MPIIKFVFEAKISDDLESLYENFVKEAREGAYKSTVTDEQVIKAIKDRFYIGIYYEDKSDEVLTGYRLIEPYVLGKGYRTTDNKILYPNRKYLRAFVIRDTLADKDIGWKLSRRKSVSKSKTVPYWRMFRLDRIKQFVVFPKKITKFRKLYNPDDKQMGTILAAAKKSDFSKGQSNKLN